MTAPTLLVGDRVAYAGHWLRATQAHELAFARGTVVEAATPHRVVGVAWDGDPHNPYRTLAANLVRLDRMHLEPV